MEEKKQIDQEKLNEQKQKPKPKPKTPPTKRKSKAAKLRLVFAKKLLDMFMNSFH